VFSAVSAVAGLVLVLLVWENRPPLPFLLAFVAIALSQLWRGSLLLRVDAAGIRLGRGLGREYGDTVVRATTVPWASIDSVRLVRSVGEGEEIDLRLRPDAPLPAGVRGVIRTPGETDVTAPELRLALPAGALDRAALQRAIAGFGGGAVPVRDAA